MTDQIYHQAAKRRVDKFDRSMAPGQLLDNNTTLFISILMMTQGTQKTDDRTDSRNADSRNGDSWNQLQLVEWEGVAYCSSTVIG